MELAEQLVAAAMDDAFVVRYRHEGEPVRIVAFDPVNHRTLAGYMNHGDEWRLSRSCRHLIEPIASVRMRTLEAITHTWETV